MALSKNLFQGILNKALRVGFSGISMGVFSIAVKHLPHPLLQSTLETLTPISKKPNLGHVYNFYSALRENWKTKTVRICNTLFLSVPSYSNFNKEVMKDTSNKIAQALLKLD